ncbi:unnamed protein product [Diplocarpon coronariae]
MDQPGTLGPGPRAGRGRSCGMGSHAVPPRLVTRPNPRHHVQIISYPPTRCVPTMQYSTVQLSIISTPRDDASALGPATQAFPPPWQKLRPTPRAPHVPAAVGDLRRTSSPHLTSAPLLSLPFFPFPSSRPRPERTQRPDGQDRPSPEQGDEYRNGASGAAKHTDILSGTAPPPVGSSASWISLVPARELARRATSRRVFGSQVFRPGDASAPTEANGRDVPPVPVVDTPALSAACCPSLALVCGRPRHRGFGVSPSKRCVSLDARGSATTRATVTWREATQNPGIVDAAPSPSSAGGNWFRSQIWGVLGRSGGRKDGRTEGRNIGRSEYRNIGISEYRNIGISEYRNIELVQSPVLKRRSSHPSPSPSPISLPLLSETKLRPEISAPSQEAANLNPFTTSNPGDAD